jgi:hypothetical protein
MGGVEQFGRQLLSALAMKHSVGLGRTYVPELTQDKMSRELGYNDVGLPFFFGR